MLHTLRPAMDEDAPAGEEVNPRAAERARLLAELAEIGMGMARSLGRQAAAVEVEIDAAAPGAEADAARARFDTVVKNYASASRAVRLTLALEAKLERDEAEARAVPVSPYDGEAVGAMDRLRVRLRRIGLSNSIDEIIEAEAPEADVARLKSIAFGPLRSYGDEALLAITDDAIMIEVFERLGLYPKPEDWPEETWIPELLARRAAAQAKPEASAEGP